MNKALVIGNGFSDREFDLSEFQCIAVVDDCKNRRFLEQATHHFFVEKKTNPGRYNAQNYAGMFKAVPVFVTRHPGVPEVYNYFHRKLRGKADYCKLGNHVDGVFVAANYFIDKGYDVTVEGIDSSEFEDISHFNMSVNALRSHNRVSILSVEEVVEECFLADTPKRIAHFFWYDRNGTGRIEMPPQFFYSLVSFSLHHPHWTVNLWTDNDFFGDVFDIVIKFGIRVLQFPRTIAPSNSCNLSSAVDYLKAFKLHQEGGMICDVADTVTLGNFDHIYDRSHKVSWSCYVQKSERLAGGGWLCCNKTGNKALKKLLDEAPANGHVFGWYEARLRKFVDEGNPCFSPEMVAPRVVFGIYADEAIAMWDKRSRFKIPAECLQFHLYAGNVLPAARYRRDTMDADCSDWRTWWDSKSIFGRLMQESVRNFAGNLDRIDFENFKV